MGLYHSLYQATAPIGHGTLQSDVHYAQEFPLILRLKDMVERLGDDLDPVLTIPDNRKPPVLMILVIYDLWKMLQRCKKRLRYEQGTVDKLFNGHFNRSRTPDGFNLKCRAVKKISPRKNNARNYDEISGHFRLPDMVEVTPFLPSCPPTGVLGNFIYMPVPAYSCNLRDSA